MKSVALVVASVAALAGCMQGTTARRTVVTPAAEEASINNTIYRVPDGEVRVVMMPMVELPALWIGQSATRALHVRVTFDNIGGRDWLVFPRKQVARVEGYGTSLAALAPTDPVVVTPGRVQVLDLYYPVPVPKFGPEVPRHVTLDWKIDGAGVTVAGRTPMDPGMALATRNRARF
jgi:hypothetical protein